MIPANRFSLSELEDKITGSLYFRKMLDLHSFRTLSGTCLKLRKPSFS